MISSFVTGERNSIGSSLVARERNFAASINLRNTCKILYISDTLHLNVMQSTFIPVLETYTNQLNDRINSDREAAYQP
jgi:hypothetical protein